MAHNRIIKVVTDLTGWAALNYVKKMHLQHPVFVFVFVCFTVKKTVIC